MICGNFIIVTSWKHSLETPALLRGIDPAAHRLCREAEDSLLLLTIRDAAGAHRGAKAQQRNPSNLNPAGKGRYQGKNTHCNHSQARLQDATGFWGRTDHVAAWQPRQHLNTMGVILQEPAHPSITSLEYVKTYSVKLLRNQSKNFTDFQKKPSLPFLLTNRICQFSGDESSSFPFLQLFMQTFHCKVFPVPAPY